MAKITEVKLNSDESFDNFFTEMQEKRGKYLYPMRKPKSSKYLPGYGLQIVQFVPSSDGIALEPLNECIIPMYFDKHGRFCLTREWLDYFTDMGYLGDISANNSPWRFIKSEQEISLKDEYYYPSLLVKRDLSENSSYVKFRVFGYWRPDVGWVKSWPEYNRWTSKERKGYFDAASRVVLYDGSRPRYSYADGLANNDSSVTVGRDECFYLYQYKRIDPEECDSTFNPDEVTNYSQTQNYGLRKKYIKFKIVENTDNIDEQG